VPSDIPPRARTLRRTLGDNVRRLRREQGLSQRSLAERSGISLSYIGRIEAGQANVRVTKLGALATALGVKAMVLLIRVSD